jgi:uncharacterized protein YkwD
MRTHVFSRHFFLLTLVFSIFFTTSSFAPSSTGLANEVLAYTNQYRKSNHLSALVMREELNKLAAKHSEDMAKGRCGFGHDGFYTRTKKIKQIFGSCSTAENVAYGAPTAQQVLEQWKGSANHRRNILGDYKYVGIGTAKDKKGVIYYTQIFVR